jgi:protein-tyrosine phosphatase
MGEALLADRLQKRGVDAVVSSAGLVLQGKPASDHALASLRDRGLDHSAHRSRIMDAGILESADLILAMTREHLREAAVLTPARFERTFTLKEIVRRATEVGPRPAGQDLEEWLAKLGAGRDRRDLLGTSPDDDVADPYGSDRASYERTCSEIESLVDRFVDLAWPAEKAA